MSIKNICLLTDFGNDDHYVGVMKSVIVSKNPNVNIIDICHTIRAQNITHARYILDSSKDYFPQSSIVMIVVDPDVGSDRKILVIKSDSKYIVAPDNGILSDLINKNTEIYEITDKSIFLNDSIHTFHGRDRFSPIAAYLSIGEELENISRRIDISEIILLNDLYTASDGNVINGKIVHIDGFGNCVTNIKSDILESAKSIKIFDLELGEIHRSYYEVEIGEAIAYIGSTGLLELGIRNGDFAGYNSIELNDEVIVTK